MKTKFLDAWPGSAGKAGHSAAGTFLRVVWAPWSIALLSASVYAAEPEPVPASNPTAVSPVAPAVPANIGGNTSNDPDEGDWKFVSRLTTLVTYDDNIFIQPSQKKDDVSLQIAPSLAIGIGNFRSELAPYAPIPHFLARTGEEDLPRKDFAYGSYTPDVVIFATHHHENALNHDVRFAGRRERELWHVQGQLGFQSILDANIDLGRRVRQTYYTADATASYDLTGKITGQVSVHGNHSDYSGGIASTDTGAAGFLDYQLAPKTAVGFGAAGGYLAVARGANQTYGQPLLEVKYQPTGKLSFTGQAGEEFRHFSSNRGDRSQFIFNLNGDYAPSDGTRVTLSGRRETNSSAQYSGEDIVATTYQGAIRQRFLQRNYLSLTGGFVHNAYESSRAVANIFRRDDYYFGRVSSSRDLTERGTVELSYEHRTNDSTIAAFGFDENLVSLAASFLF